MADPPTVNANPTVVSVRDHDDVNARRRRREIREQLAGLSAPLLIDDRDMFDDDDACRPQHLTATQASIRQALYEVSQVKVEGRRSGVSLLGSLGVRFAPLSSDERIVSSMTPDLPAAAAEDAAPQIEPPQDSQQVAPDVDEIYDLIRNIQDPEHPLTLEQLGVVSRGQVELLHHHKVRVRFTPTIPHCSMATQIGLALQVKLARSLTTNVKTTVCIQPGTHASEHAINKQLADKERVRAALENKHLLHIVNTCIGAGM